MTGKPWATCTTCGKDVSLTQAGLFYAHGDGVRTNLPFRERCPKSGQEPPLSASIRKTEWWRNRKGQNAEAQP